MRVGRGSGRLSWARWPGAWTPSRVPPGLPARRGARPFPRRPCRVARRRGSRPRPARRVRRKVRLVGGMSSSRKEARAAGGGTPPRPGRSRANSSVVKWRASASPPSSCQLGLAAGQAGWLVSRPADCPADQSGRTPSYRSTFTSTYTRSRRVPRCGAVSTPATGGRRRSAGPARARVAARSRGWRGGAPRARR